MKVRSSSSQAKPPPFLSSAGACAFVAWMVVGLSVLAWGLRWWPQPLTQGSLGVVLASSGTQSAVHPEWLMRSLGGAISGEAASAANSHFTLVGVIKAGAKDGAVLIGVEGQVAKPVRVGAEVAPGWILQSVEIRSAHFGPRLDGPPLMTLSLPPVAKMDTPAP